MWQWEEKGTHFNRNEPITGRVSARMAIHSSAVKMSRKERAKKSTLKPSLQFECVQRPSAGGTWVFTNLNWWFVLCCAETGTPKLAWNVILSCSVSNFPSAERRYLLSIKHKHMGYAELLSVAEWAERMYLSSFVRQMFVMFPTNNSSILSQHGWFIGLQARLRRFDNLIFCLFS